MIYLFYRLESGPVKLGANLHLAKQDHTKFVQPFCFVSAILFWFHHFVWFKHFVFVQPFCFGSVISVFIKEVYQTHVKKSQALLSFIKYVLKKKYSLFFIKLTLESSQSSIDFVDISVFFMLRLFHCIFSPGSLKLNFKINPHI